MAHPKKVETHCFRFLEGQLKSIQKEEADISLQKLGASKYKII